MSDVEPIMDIFFFYENHDLLKYLSISTIYLLDS